MRINYLFLCSQDNKTFFVACNNLPNLINTNLKTNKINRNSIFPESIKSFESKFADSRFPMKPHQKQGPKTPILGVLRFQRSLTDKRRENKETPIKKKRTKITATHFSPTVTAEYHFIVEFMGFSSNGKGKERKPAPN